jgi:pimeloyl-ACP methyl ester carboxylesterase
LTVQEGDEMNFLLIHGGFHGGWCWRPTAEALTNLGHFVLAPTCTGSGDRKHLLSSAIGTQSAIRDMLEVIESEEVDDLVLVGHSLAGVTISGLADILGPSRIRHLIYLDAIVLQNGATVFDSVPPEVEAARSADAAANGGQAIQPVTASTFGLKDPQQVAWVDRRSTPQAIGSFTEPLVLTNPLGNGVPRTYISCTQPLNSSVDRSREWARTQEGWRFIEFAACHDAMVERPVELAELLDQVLLPTS